ncbi:hypothetical protein HER10_EVM0012275 [Colletotrichum scovillei]|uniref:Uncharacterized protein n=1 Tax=Colletotrichum scovillei TaxID=1209932 RepID=A0A9P7QX93_9PEZI|nr:uncharacterized protein HER10_EVM0012275 [Colletotrichum scovillei]KAF4781469.1 hypothetical protein HER10_EVM0012275 [Colletotrichum scovillei]KAG7045094.1 hypothetical protein JMJ77_0009182 [Colletotrichum scovillei]KAG7052257.1 hypothetical protein JMJ78_0005278 [Colletotrichum scovillei]KAG7064548.1 hypothetical protein JMJ76_0012311 [Colletotrichum scovillei]
MAPGWLEKFIVRVDATPDKRRTEETPALEVHYTALKEHRRILGVKGDTTPRYEVKRQAVLAAWGDKCHVTSPSNGGQEVAMIDFNTLPAQTEVQFLQRALKINIKESNGKYESGELGNLHWKATGMKAYGRASWELRDEAEMILSVTIDDHQVNGVISVWKKGLGPETVEEVVMVGLSKIEEYRRMMRNAKISSIGVAANATWLAA